MARGLLKQLASGTISNAGKWQQPPPLRRLNTRDYQLVFKSQFLADGRVLGTLPSGFKGGGHIVKVDEVEAVSGIHVLFGRQSRHHMLPCHVRMLASTSDSQSTGRTAHEQKKKDISTVEDPFDAPTYNIPEKPVTFTEGASYSLIIFAGLGVAGAAAYAVFKELIFQPKEYKIFGKALERVQNDSQVRVRIGSPVTGYGQESRNRAARQRVPHRTWTDEDGIEHVEINFYIRGPHGAGKVFTEMFKDKVDTQWKYTYLIVEIKSPTPAQLMLESYVPA